MKNRVIVEVQRPGEPPSSHNAVSLKAACSYIEELSAISRDGCVESYNLIIRIKPIQPFR